MKKLSYLLVLFFAFSLAETAVAQGDKSKRPSPPKTAKASVSGVDVVIDYSAPSVKGRKIFGGLEPYGKVWRTGANEATTFSVSKDVTVNGETLPAGKYALFTIPTEGDWTVIFNKKSNQWGAYSYDANDDALRLTVTPKKSKDVQEQLMFAVGDDGKVQFGWEHQTFELMVKAK